MAFKGVVSMTPLYRRTRPGSELAGCLRTLIKTTKHQRGAAMAGRAGATRRIDMTVEMKMAATSVTLAEAGSGTSGEAACLARRRRWSRRIVPHRRVPPSSRLSEVMRRNAYAADSPAPAEKQAA